MNPLQRIVIAGASTATAVVLLFGYHTSTMGALVTAADPVTGSTTSSGSTSSGSTAAPAAGAAGGADPSSTRTVTGPTVQTQWGPVQVQLTLKGGRITDVSVLQHPSGNSLDDQINGYALPILVQETLDRQSGQIDMVSGATVTSTGYLQSLQAALDQAGV